MTLTACSHFLPRFNQRFRVPPQHAETAYRVLDPHVPRCLKYRRRVGRDNTPLAHPAVTARHSPSYAGAVVDVLEGLDGSWQCSTRGRSSPRRRHRSAPISCATCADAEQTCNTSRPHVRHWKLRHAHHLPTPRSQLATRNIVVAMTITVAFGFTVPVVIMALAVSYSASSVRVVRSRALTLSNMQYVEAARAIGSSDTRIIFRHLVPNSLPVTMVLIAVSVGAAITAEAALSFLGIGIQPPIPSWGNMLTTAQLNFDFAPHVAIAPGLAITFVVLAVNLFGDSLRDVLDPRLRNVR